MVEVNCETDFVAKNDDFRAFAAEVAQIVARDNPADVAALGARTLASGETVEARRAGARAEDRREHVDPPLRAARRRRAASRRTCTASRIGVLVDLDRRRRRARQGSRDARRGEQADGGERAKAVPADVVGEGARDRRRTAAESGKPANIVEKMVEGAVAKFLAEVTLLGQPFVKGDGKQTVGQLVKAQGADGATTSCSSSSAKASRRRRTISRPKWRR